LCACGTRQTGSCCRCVCVRVCECVCVCVCLGGGGGLEWCQNQGTCPPCGRGAA
jgi:hypothetical protein